MEANAQVGADHIELPVGTYILSIPGTDKRLLKAEIGDLDITADLTIRGAGADTTIVDGGGLDRVFHISTEGKVQLFGMVVQNGKSELGGGIANQGTLTLTDSTLSDNSAEWGGGIWNQGTLTLTDSTLSGNSADKFGGGGIWNTGTLTLTDSTLSDNSAEHRGGGIWNEGTLTLTNKGQVTGNRSPKSADIYYDTGILILPLIQSRVTILFHGGMEMIFDVPPSLRDRVQEQMDQAFRENLQIIYCEYETTINLNDFYFWYESAPDNVVEWVKSVPEGTHPMRKLGRNALTECPENLELAEQFQQSSMIR